MFTQKIITFFSRPANDKSNNNYGITCDHSPKNNLQEKNHSISDTIFSNFPDVKFVKIR